MTSGELRKRAVNTATDSGIYIFSGSRGKKLYIGKASNIKARLLSYTRTNDERLLKMVSLAKKINAIKTDSEIEALILESQYIKKYKPAFNIMLRDDKQFGFVGFTKEKFPKIFVTHQPYSNDLRIRKSKIINHKSGFIGPFTDMGALRTTLRYLRRIFPYCTCKKPHNNFCLNYHIGKCAGICCLKNQVVSSKQQVVRDYRKNIKAIKDILSGKRVSLVKKLQKEMVTLGKNEEFKKAIEIQNKIEKLKRVFENAKIIGNWSRQRNGQALVIGNSDVDKELSNTTKKLQKLLGLKKALHRVEGYDIANIQGKYAVGAMTVFTDGKPSKSEYRKFKIYTKHSPDDTAMLKEVLTRRFKHSEWPMPDLILIDGGKAQLSAALKVITNFQFSNSNFKKPKVIALTKDKNHKGVKIFVAGRKNAIPLSKLPEKIRNLLLQINSETHRFTINYYRKIHRNTMTPRFTP